MPLKKTLPLAYLLTFFFAGSTPGDQITTFAGDELHGRIVSVSEKCVTYMPDTLAPDSLREVPRQTVRTSARKCSFRAGLKMS